MQHRLRPDIPFTADITFLFTSESALNVPHCSFQLRSDERQRRDGRNAGLVTGARGDVWRPLTPLIYSGYATAKYLKRAFSILGVQGNAHANTNMEDNSPHNCPPTTCSHLVRMNPQNPHVQLVETRSQPRVIHLAQQVNPGRGWRLWVTRKISKQVQNNSGVTGC